MIEVSGNEPEELWTNSTFRNHFNSAVIYQGHIYGFDNNFLKCLSFQDGAEKWRQRGYGKGSLLLAEDHLYILSEKGEIALVPANPDVFNEVSRAKVLDGKCWTPPVLANGKLYLRNHEELVCLKAK